MYSFGLPKNKLNIDKSTHFLSFFILSNRKDLSISMQDFFKSANSPWTIDASENNELNTRGGQAVVELNKYQ